MASVLLRATRTCRPWTGRSLVLQRNIHSSLPVYKKKQKVLIDDLFAEDDADASKDGDLFSSSSSPASSPAPAPTSPRASTSTRKRKLSPEERLQRFNNLRQWVSDRIGKHPPAGKFPEQVRNSAWVHLLGLATTPEQVREVVALFPRWVEGGRVFSPRIAEAFIRRCEELHCPLIALEVFSDYQKHSLSLPAAPASQRAVHQFLHSLQQEHPVAKVVQAAALFGPYKLPPVTSDLVSCAMLTSACLRDARRHQLEMQKQSSPSSSADKENPELVEQKGKTKTRPPPSLVVALTLVPALQRLVTGAPPLPVPENKLEKERAKERVWLKWALARVEHYLPRLTRGTTWEGVQPVSVDWLAEWRARSGHAQGGAAAAA
ncbi:hypothetical protein GLOTRDRAFT_137249 [Gloeophyllum trabeum ATCC 11539]|uniref:Uncharacterized protein n=1 Tax=Gloeophyllum trabeum (strain ATCC 11539 / FP-39264 / Madison 617) TaxID=670483 RepID=S7QHD9_GLOTA|nr:uncharacterized protein GLOTRDRAFT_137249 [Gloeophyllum trabeum ATCC 11539]EPQ58572.1 hypothetical protein GLOTRDRAFT_137249 [Gloeophyllum trabeum ATCC 11539]